MKLGERGLVESYFRHVSPATPPETKPAPATKPVPEPATAPLAVVPKPEAEPRPEAAPADSRPELVTSA